MSSFCDHTVQDVARLIAEHPLAWVVARDAPANASAMLPMLGEYDEDGRLTHLVGHMARRNPLVRALEEQPRTLFLFGGPGAYISPEHAGRRDWGPTWNYAALRIEADVAFDEKFTAEAVDLLVDACEKDRDKPWTVSELKERYRVMLDAIIGFRATVTDYQATFKLAQDESDTVYRALLANHPDAELRRWMEAFNPDRPA